MSPLAQLLERHRERLLATPPDLWLNPPGDLSPSLIAPGSACLTQDETQRVQLAQQGIDAQLEAFPPLHSESKAGPKSAVFMLPREKARLRMMAHALAQTLGPDGILLAAGAVKAGARSAAKPLSTAFAQVRKTDAARHCVLYEATTPLALGPFDPKQYLDPWTLDMLSPPLTVFSLPGVFTHGGLDDGTALLLQSLDKRLIGDPLRVLDLGCGAGVIGATLGTMRPSMELVLCDNNALALAASRATLEANDIEAEVIASDGLSAFIGEAAEYPSARFDLVISNPPFHDGHRERDDKGSGVFAGIQSVLAPGGKLVIVVNRHLPWPRWMEKTFGAFEVLAATSRFHVLQGRNDRPRKR